MTKRIVLILAIFTGLFLSSVKISSVPTYAQYTSTITECSVSISPSSGKIRETEFTITGNIKGVTGYVQGVLVKDEWVVAGRGQSRPSPIAGSEFRLDVGRDGALTPYKTTFSVPDSGKYIIGVRSYGGDVKCYSGSFTLEPGDTPPPSGTCNPTNCNSNGSTDPSKWTCDDRNCKPQVSSTRAGNSCTCVPNVVTPPPSITPKDPSQCYTTTPTPDIPKCSSSRGEHCEPRYERIDAEGTLKEIVYIKTAIGCVPTDPVEFIKGLLRMMTRVGGGIALLLMISGAFQMITSNGNPDTVKKGQEQFTSAIIGLLFIIFSTLILQIIGVDILQLPGFYR